MQQQWGSVDEYFAGLLLEPDPILDEALRRAEQAGLPPINVAPNQGALLNLLARVHGAQTVLEIGTLAAYSTIWLGRALPASGRLVTLEADARHADVAHANLARAGLDGVCEVRVGSALDTLPTLETDGIGPFDLVFVDADKRNNPEYFRWAMRLSRPGTVIIVDNVVRDGRVADPDCGDADVIGTRAMTELVAAESRVTATALQTVGAKGYDGFLIARVTD